MQWTETRAAKDPQKWVDEANEASRTYNRGRRTYEVVSIDGETPTGRKRFTYRVTDSEA